MPRTQPKLKIKTRGKQYPIIDSPFYKLRSKKRLSSILDIPLTTINTLRVSEHNYSEFDDIGKSGKIRKIQQPIGNMDRAHTRIASLLCRIEIPSYLHSGRKGHSHVSNAQAHLGNTRVMTSDIKSFFPSTTRKMVFSFFYSVMKCQADIADILADICTIHNHLPTGSRISMPLAFWSSCRMFNELYALSVKHSITMTVYVDDLTFSGSDINRLFKSTVRKIISKHGHTMHPDKTKLYDKNHPKLVTGVVVKGEQIMVRNEQRKQLTTNFSCWKQIRHLQNASQMQLTSSLIGRLHSMGVIDPIFRARAKTVKSQTTL